MILRIENHMTLIIDEQADDELIEVKNRIESIDKFQTEILFKEKLRYFYESLDILICKISKNIFQVHLL